MRHKLIYLLVRAALDQIGAEWREKNGKGS